MSARIYLLALFCVSGLFWTPFFSVAVSNPEDTYRTFLVASANVVSTDIFVPDDYARIQWAINNASEGDIIHVRAGTYSENLVVNKSISLIGEGLDASVIDGQGKGTLISVNATGVRVSGFTLQNSTTGIWLSGANNIEIQQNNLRSNQYGIRLSDSRNSVFTENTVDDSIMFGMVFDKSGNTTMRNNHFSGRRYGLRVDGLSIDDFLNDVDTSNTVNDKPVYYLINQRNRVIDSSVYSSLGYLALVNSTNITLKDLSVMYSGQGILLAYTNDSIISKVTATGNWNGIEIQHSSNVTVSECNTNSNGDFGVKFVRSTNGTIVKNEADNNGWAGIGVFTSSDFTVTRNVVKNNIYGLDFVYSNNSLVTLNNAINTRDKYSIAVYYSNSNLIYHNNFYNHLVFPDINKLFKNNTWDDGFEGNHWGAYTGQDADQDGVGDTTYMLEEGNTDNHPLMGTVTDFQADSHSSVTIVSNSNISNFQFDQQTNRLTFDAIGQNNTQGFGRLRLPKAMAEEPVSILVNGQEPLTVKQLPTSSEAYQYLYVTYMNSTAASNTGIPQLYWLAPVLIAIIVFISASILLVKKRSKSKTASNTPGGSYHTRIFFGETLRKNPDL